jgi:hypothetical protein
MDFSSLKRNSGDLKEKLAKSAIATSEGSQNNDENFWKPEIDKAGNGQAVIRFLPASQEDGGDSLPWVKVFSHGFKAEGGWLIDNCLTTNNESCPVCESNTKLWDTGIDSNKNIARNRKRKLNYISNVYIVSDPKHPENEGKVFLFKFGKKIFDKITEAMNPQFEDETPINPFDFWKGADFKLKIRKVEGYQNYDKSEFDSPAPLSDDDAEMEKIWKSEFTLKDLVSADKFKTYDQLKSRLDKVLGVESSEPKTTVQKFKAEQPKSKVDVEESTFEDTATNDDDDMEYFSRLVEED